MQEKPILGGAMSGSVHSRRFETPAITSDLPRQADIVRVNRHVSNLPNADINRRDCHVRSLAGPEPDRQVFAKFKHLLRKATARSAETIRFTIGEHLRPPNAPTISETQAMPKASCSSLRPARARPAVRRRPLPLPPRPLPPHQG